VTSHLTPIFTPRAKGLRHIATSSSIRWLPPPPELPASASPTWPPPPPPTMRTNRPRTTTQRLPPPPRRRPPPPPPRMSSPAASATNPSKNVPPHTHPQHPRTNAHRHLSRPAHAALPQEAPGGRYSPAEKLQSLRGVESAVRSAKTALYALPEQGVNGVRICVPSAGAASATSCGGESGA
jgi:hypothetical protein